MRVCPKMTYPYSLSIITLSSFNSYTFSLYQLQAAPCTLLIQSFRCISATQLYLSLRIVCIGWPYQRSQLAKNEYYRDARSQYPYSCTSSYKLRLFYKQLRMLHCKKTMLLSYFFIFAFYLLKN